MNLLRFLLIIFVFVFPMNSFCFSISKPVVFYDKSDYSILVMFFVEDIPTEELIRIVKKNLDVTLFVDVKLVRSDFGILNIQTEITNMRLYYKLTYDFVTDRYIVFNDYFFKTSESLDKIVDSLFYPLLVKFNLSELRGNPDFYEIYEDTVFFVASKAKIVYVNIKPPLNIVASLLGIRNYETDVSFSDGFKIK
ncbi:MAG: hypothetical protein ACK4F9_07130 [Brevinematia bacterium]